MQFPSWAGSVTLHVAGVTFLLLFRSVEVLQVTPTIVPIDIRLPVKITAPPAPRAMGGGGGGNDSRPASKGRLPRVAPFVITLPTTETPERDVALPVPQSVLAAPVMETALLQLGDPLGLPGPPSDGPGKHGGIGIGPGGGVGDRNGPRAGNGPGIDGAYSLGGVSTAPVLIHKVEPEFSEEARRARFNGIVVLRIVIDERGLPSDIKVLQTPGMGLGERAVASVSQWRFRPGRRDGKAVPVWATVEVSFSLL